MCKRRTVLQNRLFTWKMRRFLPLHSWEDLKIQLIHFCFFLMLPFSINPSQVLTTTKTSLLVFLLLLAASLGKATQSSVPLGWFSTPLSGWGPNEGIGHTTVCLTLGLAGRQTDTKSGHRIIHRPGHLEQDSSVEVYILVKLLIAYSFLDVCFSFYTAAS